MDKAPSNSISEQDIDALIAAHDGDVALLYLYLCRRSFDAESAARTLCRTGSDIASAAEKLRRLGLFPAAPAQARAPASKPVPPPEELPEYTADDIVRRTAEDAGFKSVIDETQKLLGHALSGADMKTLFGIYDYLALPPEVIFELLNYCVDLFREKYGPGRPPSMRAIEKEAYVWANNELLTMEQAERYIEQRREQRQLAASVKNALGIRDRELTPTERKYIGEWLDMGFGADELAAAFDRTVTNTGALKWPYMNKIIQSWHQKGLHTLIEINEKDAVSRKPAAPAPAQKKSNADNLAALKNRLKSLDRE